MYLNVILCTITYKNNNKNNRKIVQGRNISTWLKINRHEET